MIVCAKPVQKIPYKSFMNAENGVERLGIHLVRPYEYNRQHAIDICRCAWEDIDSGNDVGLMSAGVAMKQ